VDEIDNLIEDSLKAKDIDGTWNYEDYKKYTIKKSINTADIMQLMDKAVVKEKDLLASRLKSDLKLRIID
jgi:hypothetical protein